MVPKLFENIWEKWKQTKIKVEEKEKKWHESEKLLCKYKFNLSYLHILTLKLIELKPNKYILNKANKSNFLKNILNII